MKQYVTVLAEAGEDFSEPFGLYWETLEAEEKHSGEMLEMLAVITEEFSDIENPWTAYFMKNRAAYAKQAHQEVVDYYMLQGYIYNVYYLAQLEEGEKTKAKIEELLTLFPEARPEFKARWAFYKAALETPPNKKKVERLRKNYLKVTVDMEELNERAWAMVMEEQANKKQLKEALAYINRSVAANAHYYNLHIQASILNKLGKNKEAITAAQAALKAAGEMGLNEEQTYETYALLKELGAGSE